MLHVVTQTVLRDKVPKIRVIGGHITSQRLSLKCFQNLPKVKFSASLLVGYHIFFITNAFIAKKAFVVVAGVSYRSEVAQKRSSAVSSDAGS